MSSFKKSLQLVRLFFQSLLFLSGVLTWKILLMKNYTDHPPEMRILFPRRVPRLLLTRVKNPLFLPSRLSHLASLFTHEFSTKFRSLSIIFTHQIPLFLWRPFLVSSHYFHIRESKINHFLNSFPLIHIFCLLRDHFSKTSRYCSSFIFTHVELKFFIKKLVFYLYWFI